ncbi:hypothetical protein [Comamonas sp. MYb69]|uniref:hypothetical protein n=1 Tax=Comamonas sp. MYb69 TaxID=1848650 RepID=UPI0030A309ED
MINTKFNEFEIQFSNQTSVRFENFKNKNDRKAFRIYYIYPGKNGAFISASNEFDVHRFAKELANKSGYLLQTADNKWIDRRTDEVFLDEEILSRSDAYSYLTSSAMKAVEPTALKKLEKKLVLI